MDCCPDRIDGVTVWVGSELTGGYFEGAVKVGTVQYEDGKSTPYTFSGVDKVASSVQIKGNNNYLELAEVEVDGK
jgi:hypothetical protein